MTTTKREAKIDLLRHHEVEVFRMALFLLKKEPLAICVTKQVLQQIWQDSHFEQLSVEEQQKKLVKLVGKASICQLTA